MNKAKLWTLLMVWHAWRAAVWSAVLAKETRWESFDTRRGLESFKVVSAQGRRAQTLRDYHIDAHLEIRNRLHPDQSVYAASFREAAYRMSRAQA